MVIFYKSRLQEFSVQAVLSSLVKGEAIQFLTEEDILLGTVVTPLAPVGSPKPWELDSSMASRPGQFSRLGSQSS